MVYIEDTPPTMLGLQDQSKSSAQSGVGVDISTVVKNMLTSDEVTLLACTMENGRKTEKIKAQCSASFCFGANASTGAVDPGILSRLFVSMWSKAEGSSEEGPSAHATKARKNDPTVRQAFEDMQTYYRRTQILMCENLLRMHTKMLADCNLSAFETFYDLLAKQLKRTAHIDIATGDRKKAGDYYRYKRLEILVRVFVVWDALDLYYDSCLSPIKEQPHQEIHFLGMEKHLVAQKQHIIYALGLLSSQYQNDLRVAIIAKMKLLFFKDADAKIAKMNTPISVEETVEGMDQAPVPPHLDLPSNAYVPLPRHGNRAPSAKDQAMLAKPEVQAYLQEKAYYDGIRDERANWAYATCIMGPGTFHVQSSNGKAPSVRQVVEAMANHIIRFLPSKPLLAEVIDVLMQLTKDTADETRQVIYPKAPTEVQESSSAPSLLEDEDFDVQPETVSAVSALLIEGDRVRMSLRVLDTASRPNVFMDAVQAVADALEDPNNEAGTDYVYGDVDTEHKFMWRIMHAKYRENALGKEDRKVWHADYAPPILREMTRSMLRTVQPDTPQSFLNEMFPSRTPFSNVDADIDLLAIQQHARHLGLNRAAQEAKPSMFHRVTDEQIRSVWAKRRHKPMPRYPEALYQSLGKEAMAGWKRASDKMPERFSMAEQYKRARIQDEEFEAPEPLDAPPHLEHVFPMDTSAD